MRELTEHKVENEVEHKVKHKIKHNTAHMDGSVSEPTGDTTNTCCGPVTSAVDKTQVENTECCSCQSVNPWGDYRHLLPRLARIEGQIRGIRHMVEDGRYCVDILTQLSAAQAALRQVSMAILTEHTKGCVARAIKEDQGDEAIEELLAVVGKLWCR